jgi:hypothetical protein
MLGKATLQQFISSGPGNQFSVKKRLAHEVIRAVMHRLCFPANSSHGAVIGVRRLDQNSFCPVHGKSFSCDITVYINSINVNRKVPFQAYGLVAHSAPPKRYALWMEYPAPLDGNLGAWV